MDKNDLVAVIVGGPSSEAAISRITGAAIADALREKGYNVIELELEPEKIFMQLRELDVKVVFNAVHGMYGEDGRLQSILEAAAIPYTGSGVLASAVAMDKAATKRFLLSAGVSTPKSLILNRKEKESPERMKREILKTFSLPVVIKAATQGSSIGVNIVKNERGITYALQDAFKYSENVVVEECISGKELTVAILEHDGGTRILPVIWIAPHSGAYDFHSKYTKGATDYHCPAPLSEEQTAHVCDLALATYKVLGLSGVARIDVMLDDKGQGYVLEANTIPGMTATSLVPKAAAAVGINFPELCELILLSAR